MSLDFVHGDARSLLPNMDECSVDACVTDPPYELGFMGKAWDQAGVSFDPEFWRAVLRVLKPGAHLLAFGGTRTYHRMACAIEGAGFEIRDSLHWIYGTGFPKSLNVGEGRGTALKPGHEPIVLARKPLIGTVAKNILEHGTGALNIAACRIEYRSAADKASATPQGSCTAKSGALAGGVQNDNARAEFTRPEQLGRWPANVLLDEDAAAELDAQSGDHSSTRSNGNPNDPKRGRPGMFGLDDRAGNAHDYRDSGGASRFFYVAKPSRRERGEGNNHPTVKPVTLMRYLVRLVTPPGGLVLDPFAGSGTTGIACREEGVNFIGLEREEPYIQIAQKRLAA